MWLSLAEFARHLTPTAAAWGVISARLVAFGKDAAHAPSELDIVDLDAIAAVRA